MTEAFLNYLKFEKRYSSKTVESYKTDILQFFHFIKLEFELEDALHVKNNQVRAFVVQLVNDKRKPTSIKRKISALKSFYKYHQKIGKLKTNPADKINSPKIPERLPKFVEQQKINNLFEEPEKYFKNTFEGMQEKLLIDVLYSTGMRRQELINLKWSDINFSSNQVKVTGKGNKQRLIPIGNELVNSLRIFQNTQINQLKNIPKAAYVFLTKDGNQLYPNYVYRIVKLHIGHCSTAEKKSPHVLRHSFATHMSNNGAKLNDIKELLGHASLASTQVYTHNTIEQLKEIYKLSHPKA
ncbi:MAG TPA: tyrosine-type recombinase/integrase [Candidatus Portnoybacteria bacterium]|jgi:integrase/recombinase XerC|nr:tyrosine-type recombinase/integrase [Candidatus Portnoybacteria bacterium]